jgi:CBS domain-containing protein
MPIPRTAGELMTTDVVTLDEHQGIDHLEEAFRVCRFRHMPVVDGDRVIGLVTLRDVLRTSASSLVPSKATQNEFLFGRFKVRDIMATDVVTVPASAPLEEVAELMQKRKLGCVPVVADDSNRLAGILTEADFVRLSAELLRAL